ncbi:MAG: hypothetical protein KC729_20450 [Candidatus Eisenbacteria bacterium]|uniref:Uncharacterized protein n=1 Tax=Eiseniibacteriota bacterium TaxID=2212470 RepID=A0A956M2N3_UNCEI|nr:hypothetical protein [Candidatus Eisenbacteria bacterium]
MPHTESGAGSGGRSAVNLTPTQSLASAIFGGALTAQDLGISRLVPEAGAMLRASPLRAGGVAMGLATTDRTSRLEVAATGLSAFSFASQFAPQARMSQAAATSLSRAGTRAGVAGASLSVVIAGWNLIDARAAAGHEPSRVVRDSAVQAATQVMDVAVQSATQAAMIARRASDRVVESAGRAAMFHADLGVLPMA